MLPTSMVKTAYLDPVLKLFKFFDSHALLSYKSLSNERKSLVLHLMLLHIHFCFGCFNLHYDVNCHGDMASWGLLIEQCGDHGSTVESRQVVLSREMTNLSELTNVRAIRISHKVGFS